MGAASAPVRSLQAAATWQALVAHDLKNALGTLEDRLAGLVVEPTSAGAEQAHRQCRELRRKLVGLLLVQRGEAEGGLPAWCTDECPADLLPVLADAPPWTREDLVVDCRVAPDTPECWTFDRHLVRLALEAALHNAGRHARRRVQLGVAADRGGLRFEVLDDGPGPGVPSDHERSTGLGTALCRAVAEAHRMAGRTGEVSLDAQGLPQPDDAQPPAEPQPLPPGTAPRGARFSLWLP